MKLRITLSTLMLVLVAAAAPAPKHHKPKPKPRVIEIHAKRFGFEPNLVTVKKGETVTINLVSEDVTHGFFSRALNVDETVSPEAATHLTLTPAIPGKYPIICDHFCGAGHGTMGLTMVVEE